VSRVRVPPGPPRRCLTLCGVFSCSVSAVSVPRLGCFARQESRFGRQGGSHRSLLRVSRLRRPCPPGPPSISSIAKWFLGRDNELMKRLLPFIISMSLLIGLLATICTSRAVGAMSGAEVPVCGYSVNSQTGQHTTIHSCLQGTYGWPIKYSTSGVWAILRDYHTINPTDPTNGSSFIGGASFSRLAFVEDWIIWSIPAYAVVAGIAMMATKDTYRKTAKNKKK
jgi:hypothetical protein